MTHEDVIAKNINCIDMEQDFLVNIGEKNFAVVQFGSNFVEV